MAGERSERMAPITGVVAAVLLVVGLALSSTEDFLDDGEAIADAYLDDTDRIVAGCQIGVIGAALLIHFAAVLSSMLRRGGDNGRLAGAVLAAGGAVGALWLAGFIVQAAGALRADEDNGISPESAATLNDLATLLALAAAPVASAVLVAATAISALRIRAVLPVWLAVVSLVLAVALLILPINWLMTAVFGLWLIGVSVLLTVRPVRAGKPPEPTAATSPA